MLFRSVWCFFLSVEVSQKAGIIIAIQLTDRNGYLSPDVLRTVPWVFDLLPLFNFWDLELALSSLPLFSPPCPPPLSFLHVVVGWFSGFVGVFFWALWLPSFIPAHIVVLCGVSLFSVSFMVFFFWARREESRCIKTFPP